MDSDNQPPVTSAASTPATTTDKPSTPAWSFGSAGSQTPTFNFLNPSLVSGASSNTENAAQQSMATSTPAAVATASTGWSFANTGGSEAPKFNFLNTAALNRDFPGSGNASSKKRRDAPESDEDDPDRADRSNRRIRGSNTPYERADTDTTAPTSDKAPVDKSHRQIKTPVSRLKKLQEQRRLRGVGATSGDVASPPVPTLSASAATPPPAAKAANPFAGFSFGSPGAATSTSVGSPISFASHTADASKEGGEKSDKESEVPKSSESITSAPTFSFKPASTSIPNPFSFTPASKPASTPAITFGSTITTAAESTESTTAIVTAKPALDVSSSASKPTSSPFTFSKPTEKSDATDKPAQTTFGDSSTTTSAFSFKSAESFKPSAFGTSATTSGFSFGTPSGETAKTTAPEDKTSTTKSSFGFGGAANTQFGSSQFGASGAQTKSSPFSPAKTASAADKQDSEKTDDVPTSTPASIQATSGFSFGTAAPATSTASPFSTPAPTSSPFSFITASSSADANKPSTSDEAPAVSKPAFSFATGGAQTPSSTFSFGKPAAAVQTEKSDAASTAAVTTSAVPAFSFKPTTSEGDSAIPFSFASASTAAPATSTASPFSTPAPTSSPFSFITASSSGDTASKPSTTDEAPAVSKPAFSFATGGAQTPSSTFSFGKPAAAVQTEKSDAAASTAASTAAVTTSAAPAFSFKPTTSEGDSASPFSFASASTAVPATSTASPFSTPAPTSSPFSFITASSSGDANKPSTSAEAPVVSKPAFSFATGGAQTTSSTFSFGKPAAAAQTEKSDATSTAAVTTSAAPAFSFKPTTSESDSSSPFSFASASKPAATTSVSAPAAVDKPKSEFSFDKIAASIATTTPSSSIALSVSAPASSTGPTSIFAPLAAQQQTGLTTTVTTSFKPDTILKSTRYMELPDDAKHELDELERMIQVEVQTCDYIRARKAAMDENVITSVRKEADEMTKKLDALNNRLNGNMERIKRLLGGVDYEMRSASVAKIVVDTYKNPASGGKWLSGHNVHNEYFKRLAHTFEIRLERYRQNIAEIEMTVSSLAKGTRQSPHAIAEVMKYQNKSFIAVAGKVAAIHDEIEKLKELYLGSYGNKTIKLSANNTAGSAKKAPSQLNLIASTTLKPFSETFK
ncbi:unnamed protein product [Umbelopsis vinacea]